MAKSNALTNINKQKPVVIQIWSIVSPYHIEDFLLGEATYYF